MYEARCGGIGNGDRHAWRGDSSTPSGPVRRGSDRFGPIRRGSECPNTGELGFSRRSQLRCSTQHHNYLRPKTSQCTAASTTILDCRDAGKLMIFFTGTGIDVTLFSIFGFGVYNVIVPCPSFFFPRSFPPPSSPHHPSTTTRMNVVPAVVPLFVDGGVACVVGAR